MAIPFRTASGSKKALTILILAVTLAIFPPLTGCADIPAGTKFVLTTGMPEDVLFYIDESTCTVQEFKVYLTDIRLGYENSFGAEIWQVDAGDEPMGEVIRQICLSHLTRIKIMQLMARDEDIALDVEEEALAVRQGREYYSRLSAEELSDMGEPSEELMIRIMTENALARKLYEYLIKDINPEISDDEARRITVEWLLIKDHESARDARKQLSEGKSFEELMTEYGKDNSGTISFGKGETDLLSEQAAFNLDVGQVSDIIETPDGYMIYKCINNFNREETEANKIRIVKERQQEGFLKEFDVYASEKTRIMNEEVWDTLY